MTARAATAAPRSAPGTDAPHGLRAPVLGMVLFIASEVMFFGALFGAYFTVRADARAWPPGGSPDIELLLPLLLTAILLTSSLTQHLALQGLKRGDRYATTRWVLATIALGVAFLAGEGWEWLAFVDQGFTVSTNVFGTLFFTMTGFHGLHLAAGLVMLLLALAKARGTGPLGRKVGSMEAATLYWHFVDGVWLFLLTSLYLLNVLS